MGSLVAGWDSPTSRSGKARLERNKSSTNEEIETFWKTKRMAEEDHLKAVAEGQAQCQGQAISDIQSPTDNYNIKESEAVLIRGDTHRKLAANRPVGLDSSRTFPGCNTTTVVADSRSANDDEDLHNLRKAKAWWTRSNWAFLNEPPLMATEGSTEKYATQYHVGAKRGTNELGDQKVNNV